MLQYPKSFVAVRAQNPSPTIDSEFCTLLEAGLYDYPLAGIRWEGGVGPP